MPKGSFWNDTFEKLAELGTSAVKKTGQSVKQTFDPGKMVEQVTGNESSPNNPNNSKEQLTKKKGHTKLDLDKLQKSYQDQDKQKTDALRNKLFQLVKSGEEKVMQEKEQKEKDKQQQILNQEQEKKRKREEEEKRRMESEAAPQGKERRSIFSRKKRAKPIPTVETKANSGKQ